ncbi:MAG: thiamine diphosphokinase [Schaedlerella sp.]|nr:thiamine diphosphokinase [Schaedlerella sp.]
MKEAVIVSGGMLDEEFVLSILREKESRFLIAVDKGLLFLHEHGICPDYIVGDFDSVPDKVIAVYKEKKRIPIREFNPVKDATDTEIAIRLAIEFECQQITILGGTGTRLDHVWGNVQSLKIALDAGVKAYLIDQNNRIQIFEKNIILKKEEAYGKYFSIFPLGGIIQDLSIDGAKYPLLHHTLTPFDSLCVSNEIKKERATVTFTEGIVVLMETKD